MVLVGDVAQLPLLQSEGKTSTEITAFVHLVLEVYFEVRLVEAPPDWVVVAGSRQHCW